MSRIRTVKPEWLDDERLLTAGSDARVLSIALIILSDDHGRGRLTLSTPSRVFPETPENFREAFARLSGWYVEEYAVRGQRYFQIINWKKHQKVDKPGKPQVPPPETSQIGDSRELSRESRETPENFRETLAPDLDQDRDQYPDQERVVDEARETGRRSLQAKVLSQMTLTPNGTVVYKLLDMLSELHCRPDGRPVTIPGVVPSANDITALGKLADAAVPLASDADLPVMEYIAIEWLALLALIASGDAAPKGNAVRYFIARFGRLENDRTEAAAPMIPARTEAAA